MTVSELERLVCPKCGETNRPGVSQLITVDDHRIAHCGVCATFGLDVSFMPWLWERPEKK